MNENEVIYLMMVLALVGGALGAKTANAAPWKGAIVAAVAMAVTGGSAIILSVDNLLLTLLCSLVVSAIIGSILGLTSRQTTQVILGQILVGFIGAAILGGMGGS